MMTRTKAIAMAAAATMVTASSALAIGANFGLFGFAAAYQAATPLPISTGAPEAPAEQVQYVDVPAGTPTEGAIDPGLIAGTPDTGAPAPEAAAPAPAPAPPAAPETPAAPTPAPAPAPPPAPAASPPPSPSQPQPQSSPSTTAKPQPTTTTTAKPTPTTTTVPPCDDHSGSGHGACYDD